MSETRVEVAGRTVRVSSPERVLFPETGITKLDLVGHYLRCAPGAVRGVWRRPTSLKRWPGGASHDFFFTKRAPGAITHSHPVRFPSARFGVMPYIEDATDIVEQVQLGVIDLNPWNVRISDLDHPDELRFDLDPTPGFGFEHCSAVAGELRVLLEENGLIGWPKTSGSRGIHVYVRIEPLWDQFQVRRAGLALARELERRTDLVTTAWWKEERSGVFIDYNQNGPDRTVASAYSVRHTGLVSTPFAWGELDTIDPTAMTIPEFASRWEAVGDVTAGIDAASGDLSPVMRMVDADEDRGLGDAPWPPHFPKMPGEPMRVQPSRRRPEK